MSSGSQTAGLKPGWSSIDLKACEVIEDKNSKKFKLVPIDGAKVKKEKLTCGSDCCRSNWMKKLAKAKMNTNQQQSGLVAQVAEEEGKSPRQAGEEVK